MKLLNNIPENDNNVLCTNDGELSSTFSDKQLTIINLKYPQQVPIIVSKCKSSTLSNLEKKKFVVYRRVYVVEFKYLIQKRLKLDSSQAMFFFIDNWLIDNNITIGEVFDRKNIDGILYITYTNENAFG
jgi:GABA(A) receptor-associated protein